VKTGKCQFRERISTPTAKLCTDLRVNYQSLIVTGGTKAWPNTVNYLSSSNLMELTWETFPT